MGRYATGIYCEKDKDGNTFYLISYIDYFSQGHDLISDKIVAFTIGDNGIQPYNAFRINGKESSTFAFDYNISNDTNLTPISYDATHKMLIVPEIDSQSSYNHFVLVVKKKRRQRCRSAA